MFPIISKNIIFNPLEQFEIHEFTYSLSCIFKNLINNNIYTSTNWSIYWTDSFNILYTNEQYFFLTFSFLDLNFYFLHFLFEVIPSSDFFIVIQLLLIFFFFLLYQNILIYQFYFSPIQYFYFSIICFVLNIIKNTNKNLIKYSPFLLTLFIFILLLNILGLIPFVKSLTSTLSITFFLSMSAFIGLNLEGLLLQKIHFFDKFAPSNVPFAILPMLVLIELISYFMRPNSLAVRLFSNMLAGHILIKLFISFCLDFSSISWILFFSCFFLICILMSLEVFISFLQAYIFMLLSLLYLDDVLNGSH